MLLAVTVKLMILSLGPIAFLMLQHFWWFMLFAHLPKPGVPSFRDYSSQLLLILLF